MQGLLWQAWWLPWSRNVRFLHGHRHTLFLLEMGLIVNHLQVILDDTSKLKIDHFPGCMSAMKPSTIQINEDRYYIGKFKIFHR